MATLVRNVLVAAVLVAVVAVPLLHRVEQDRTYRNLHVVEDGRLYRCGQLTPDGFARVVRELGVGTVVSLRDTKDDNQEYENQFEEDVCQAANVRYERFPSLKWAAADGSMPLMTNVQKFLALMDDKDVPKPVLVHCFAGIHRTGAHVAAYRVARQGWTTAEAMAELQSMGTPRTKYSDELTRFVNALPPGR